MSSAYLEEVAALIKTSSDEESYSSLIEDDGNDYPDTLSYWLPERTDRIPHRFNKKKFERVSKLLAMTEKEVDDMDQLD